MIHAVNEALLGLSLEDFILTFDDGLFSQFYYWPEIQKLNTEKYFFISSGIISSGQQNLNFPSSSEAHEKARQGNFEDFMTVEQIKTLMSDPQVTIGGHGHAHINLSNVLSLKEKIDIIKDDTEKMFAWFENNLNFKPTTFCFPYNNSERDVYTAILKSYGVTNFFGQERVAI